MKTISLLLLLLLLLTTILIGCTHNVALKCESIADLEWNFDVYDSCKKFIYSNCRIRNDSESSECNSLPDYVKIIKYNRE